MKKIFIVLCLIASVLVGRSQILNYQLKSQYNATVDTITAGVKYLTSLDLGVGSFSSFTIVVKYIEISGTTAGTAKIEYSLDGLIWSTLPTDSVFTATDAATNIYMWAPSQTNKRIFRYIRVAFTPSGTMSDAVYARFIGVR